MKQHILVIGAGFGGVWSALSAARLVQAMVAVEEFAATTKSFQGDKR